MAEEHLCVRSPTWLWLNGGAFFQALLLLLLLVPLPVGKKSCVVVCAEKCCMSLTECRVT